MHKNIESEVRAVTRWPNNNHSLKAVLKLETKAITLQYRQDVRHIPIVTREKTSLAIHVVQKITIIRAQKIGKFAV